MTYKETPQQGEEDFSISLKQGRPIHEKCQARIAELEGENERLLQTLINAAGPMRKECELWSDALTRWEPFYHKRAQAMKEALEQYDNSLKGVQNG